MPKNNRSRDWFRQAKSDLRFAQAALKGGFYCQACFISQQASEKALKSILYHRGAKMILTHSLYRLCKELKINKELLKNAGILDQYYVSARYPDALPEGTPDDVFTNNQAREAIEIAEMFVNKACKVLQP